ncbi:MAG: hypothetical protein SV765_11920 [Pseudomonadota bacterium]|nr:hypothetical protein [Pseudomonadota bacterium]
MPADDATAEACQTTATAADVTRVVAQNLVDPLVLQPDLVAQTPLYVHWQPQQNVVTYGSDPVALLETVAPLTINQQGLSFLLQDGVIPPPASIYQNVFILSVGDQLTIRRSHDQKLKLTFTQHFPFSEQYKQQTIEHPYNESRLLEQLVQPLLNAGLNHTEHYLFHSAGKDSNYLALAMAEAGLGHLTQSVTYKAHGPADESEIVAKLCKKLGFRHRSVTIPRHIKTPEQKRVVDYFTTAPFPCTDNAALLYPLIAPQLDSHCHIIDGMGNDIYIGHIPPAREYRLQTSAGLMKALHGLLPQGLLPLELEEQLRRTRAHRTGLSGLPHRTLTTFFPGQRDTRDFWLARDREFGTADYLEFRARIRGGIIDNERFIRKLRNAAAVNAWRLHLPWMDATVAHTVFHYPQPMLFDRKRLRNKIFIRESLKTRLQLDSDQLGKKAFAFDYHGLQQSMQKLVDAEVLACPYWDRKELEPLYRQFWSDANSASTKSQINGAWIHRLFLISGWLNHCKYLEPATSIIAP